MKKTIYLVGFVMILLIPQIIAVNDTTNDCLLYNTSNPDLIFCDDFTNGLLLDVWENRSAGPGYVNTENNLLKIKGGGGWDTNMLFLNSTIPRNNITIQYTCDIITNGFQYSALGYRPEFGNGYIGVYHNPGTTVNCQTLGGGSCTDLAANTASTDPNTFFLTYGSAATNTFNVTLGNGTVHSTGTATGAVTSKRWEFNSFSGEMHCTSASIWKGDLANRPLLSNVVVAQYVDPTPADSFTSESQLTVNVTCSNLESNLLIYLDNNVDPTTLVVNSSNLNASYTTSLTTTQTVYYKAACNDQVNASTRSYNFEISETPSFTNVNHISNVGINEVYNYSVKLNFSNSTTSGITNVTMLVYNHSTKLFNVKQYLFFNNESNLIVNQSINVSQGEQFFAYKWRAETNLSGINTSQTYYTFINHTATPTADIHLFDEGFSERFLTLSNLSKYILNVSIPNFANVQSATLQIGGAPSTIFDANTLPFALNLTLPNSSIFNFSDRYSLSQVTIDFSSDLNTILQDECICDGCVKSGDYCTVPIELNNSVGGSYHVTNLAVDYDVNITDCSGGNDTAFNLQMYDEVTRSLLNSDLDITFIMKLAGVNFQNYSNAFSGANNYSVCISPSYANLTADVKATYNSSGYTLRNYFSSDVIVNNDSANLDFYLLNEGDSSTVLINVQDENSVDVEGAIVKILRFYPSTGKSELVQSLQTDFNGNTIAKLHLFDVQYSIVVEIDGEVVFTSDSRLITGTTLNININRGEFFVDVFQNIVGIDSSLTYNNDTGVVTYTYFGSPGVINGACLKVEQITTANNIVLCNTCSTSTSSILTCSINNSLPGTYQARGIPDFVGGSPHLDKVLDFVTSPTAVFGNIGIFGAALLTLTLGLLGIFSPTIAIGMTILGVIFMSALNIVPFTWQAVMSLIVVGMILFGQMRE